MRPCARFSLSRGKVDVVVRLASGSASPPRLEIDFATAAQYVAAARTLQERHDLPSTLDVARSCWRCPACARTVERELADEAVKRALRSAFDVALDALVAVMHGGGRANSNTNSAHGCNRVAALADLLESRAVVADAVRERLRKRAEQLRSETGFEDGSATGCRDRDRRRSGSM